MSPLPRSSQSPSAFQNVLAGLARRRERMPVGFQQADAPQIRDGTLLLVDADGVRIALAEGEIGRGITLHVINRRRQGLIARLYGEKKANIVLIQSLGPITEKWTLFVQRMQERPRQRKN